MSVPPVEPPPETPDTTTSSRPVPTTTTPTPQDDEDDHLRALAQAALSQLTGASDHTRSQRIEQVETFQRAYGHGLTADGLYGPGTRHALSEVLAMPESSFPVITSVRARPSSSTSSSSSPRTSTRAHS